MDKIYVKDLAEKSNKEIETVMLINEINIKPFSNKDSSYVQLVLSDKTGQVNAFIWDSESLEFDKGDLITFKARVRNTKEFGLQLILDQKSIKKVTGDYSEFIKTTKLDIDKMFNYLIKLIEQDISDINVKKMLEGFYKNSNYSNMIKKVPVTLLYNHNFLGGLLEYTYSLTKVIGQFKEFNIDYDLLLSGALLFKSGKVFEFSQSPFFELSKEAIVPYYIYNYRILNDISKGLELDITFKNKLINIITSTKARFIEHIILTQMDYSLANISSFINTFESLKGNNVWELDKKKNTFLFFD
jgi:hypothetical protein